MLTLVFSEFMLLYSFKSGRGQGNSFEVFFEVDRRGYLSKGGAVNSPLQHQG